VRHFNTISFNVSQAGWSASDLGISTRYPIFWSFYPFYLIDLKKSIADSALPYPSLISDRAFDFPQTAFFGSLVSVNNPER